MASNKIELELKEILGSSSEEDLFEDSGSEYLLSDLENVPQNENKDEVLKPIQTRKRKRHAAFWAKNVRKHKRNSGLEYISSTGKIVPAKRFKSSDCKCKRKCNEKISCTQQEAIFNYFYGLANFDQQSAYLFTYIRVVDKQRCYTKNNSRREKTRIYNFLDSEQKEHQVCKYFFKSVLQISDGRISRVLKNKSEGLSAPLDKRGKHSPQNKTSKEKMEQVKNFIGKFPVYVSHYSREKNPNRKYLSPDLNIRKLYSLYKEEMGKIYTEGEPVSVHIFRKIFNENFNLYFHPPVTDSCKKCDMYDIKIRYESNDEKIVQQLKIERELHQRKAESARLGLKQDKLFVSNNADECTAIAFDLMKTLPTPQISTGLCYYKRQLWTYCLGIHNLGNDEVLMFLWDESKASRGPQEIGSCLLYYVKNFVKTKNLIMYSDQCGGQNRNIKMALLCSYIVNSKEFAVTTIDHKFLVSGHSYLPCDQDFGLIEKQKKFHLNIFVPNDWELVISNARKRNPFKIIIMTEKDFFSTRTLEENITNRKVTDDKTKVEWMKIQWLRFQQSDPYTIFFKYSNQEYITFDKCNIKKRNFKNSVEKLPLLYPNGHAITDLKKKDLESLLPFIPPCHHNFYTKLSTSKSNNIDYVDVLREDDE